MTALVYSANSNATESTLVQVESSHTRGLSGLQLVGLCSEVCKAGLDRAKLALEHCGLALPASRVAVNLAPAPERKDGSQLDLAFACSLALLLEEGGPAMAPSEWLFAAELSLDGQLRPVRNIVSHALQAAELGLKGIIVAPENMAELATVAEIDAGALSSFHALAFRELRLVLAWLFAGDRSGLSATIEERPPRGPASMEVAQPNFDDMLMSPELEELALVVAAGEHSLLLCGSPGCGKSMFSSRLPSILPPLAPARQLEAMRIHSAVHERVPDDLLAARPPFRAPHHQASAAALLGIPEAPGEISLAHGGVLFLDELPEYRRDLLEGLREPLETGNIRVSRARAKVTWPAKFTLIAACNLCPCGWLGSKKRRCQCAASRIVDYRRKLSGPILDRIDLHYAMPETTGARADAFLAQQMGERRSAGMQARVLEARRRALTRNKALGAQSNATLKAKDIVAASGLGEEDFRKIVGAELPPDATYRSAARSLRVARTLADLREDACVRAEDLRKAWSWQRDEAARKRGDQSLGIA